MGECLCGRTEICTPMLVSLNESFYTRVVHVIKPLFPQYKKLKKFVLMSEPSQNCESYFMRKSRFPAKLVLKHRLEKLGQSY